MIGILGQTAQLELFDLEVNLAPPSNSNGFPAPKESLYELLAGQQALVDDGDEDDLVPVRRQEEAARRPGQPSATSCCRATSSPKAGGDGGKLPKGWRIFGVPPKTVVVTCGVGEVVCPGVGVENPKQNFYYLLQVRPEQCGSEQGRPGDDRRRPEARRHAPGLRHDDRRADRDDAVHRTRAATGSARSRTARPTAAALRYNITGGQGDPQDSFQHFAIVLDRQIKSWPSIDFEQYPNGIGGSNGAQITGIGSLTEAKDLALVLQSGALPVTFKTLETTAISATLGKDSLAEAWKAAIAGLLVVALFLLIFYRVLGVVAVIGLGIYAAFLYAAILAFNVTLTLPGFAGMILTLGVAADANIVIFERVKEEYRAGKSVRAAISAGYGKGFATIIDANVVTAITAMVLFLVATAGVKGFALMLLIGTLISLLTAVAATRAILGLLAGFKWFDNPKLMGAEGEPPTWIRRDFIGLRKYWFGISAVVARDLDPRDRDQGPQPRDRLRGRHEDHGDGAGGAAGRRRGRPRRGGEARPRQRPDRRSRRSGRRQVHGLPDPDRGALGRGVARPDPATLAHLRSRLQRPDRLGELRAPDRRGRDPRDHRLAAPDHDLHLLPLPGEVRRRR